MREQALRGGHEQITTSFRSNPQMLAALNAVFDRVLQREAGTQPGNVPLTPPAGAADARRPPIVLGLGQHDPKAGTAELRRAEAQGDRRSSLHAAHRDGWEIRDRRDGDNWRRCRWGDTAGALRSTAFALSDEDLVIHVAQPGSLSYRSTL